MTGYIFLCVMVEERKGKVRERERGGDRERREMEREEGKREEGERKKGEREGREEERGG